MLNRWIRDGVSDFLIRGSGQALSREHVYCDKNSIMHTTRAYAHSASALRELSTKLIHRRYSLRETKRVDCGKAPLPDNVLKAWICRGRLETLQRYVQDQDVNVKNRSIVWTKIIHTTNTKECLRWTAPLSVASVVSANMSIRLTARAKVNAGVRVSNGRYNLSPDEMATLNDLITEVGGRDLSLVQTPWGRMSVWSLRRILEAETPRLEAERLRRPRTYD